MNKLISEQLTIVNEKISSINLTKITLSDITNVRDSLNILNVLFKQVKIDRSWNIEYDKLLALYKFFLNNYKKLKVNYNYSIRIDDVINIFLQNLGFIKSQYGGNRNKVFKDSFYGISDDTMYEQFREKKFKFVIIGGGPIGLYMTYKLSLEYPDSNILLADNRVSNVHERKFTRSNVLFKVPDMFMNPNKRLNELNKDHFDGDGHSIYRIEQRLTELIQAMPNVDILYTSIDIINLIAINTINVDYLLNTTGGRLTQLTNDDNIDLIHKLSGNPYFNNKFYPLISGLNQYVLDDEANNFKYKPETFMDDRENPHIVYDDISKISSKLPSQIYITDNGSFFIKFDMGVSFFNTNTSTGMTLYYGILQLIQLIEALKESKA